MAGCFALTHTRPPPPEEALVHPLEVSPESEKIFELSPVPLSFLDVEGRFLKVNPSWARHTGHQPNELVGTCFLDHLPLEDQPLARRELQAVREGAGSVSFRARFQNKKGGVFFFDWHVLRPNADGPLFAIAYDLTALHEVERELSESREKFQILADCATEGIVLSERGIILEANAAMSRMSGFTPEEIVGQKVLKFVPQKDHAKVMEKIQQEGADFYELTGVRKDGSTFPMEIMGRFMTYQGRQVRVTLLRDITDREQLLDIAHRKTDLALQDQEKFFRVLSENALDVVLVHDAEGTVHYLSPSTQWVLGYDPAAYVGKNVFEFIHPEDLGTAMEVLKRLVAGEIAQVSFSLRARHQNGSWRDMETISRNLVDDPIVRGIVVCLRDVTDRKHVENALRESESRLRGVFNSGRQILVLVDREARLLAFNPNAQEITRRFTGRTLELGMCIQDFLKGESTSLLSKSFQQALQGESVSIEAPYPLPDGTQHWFNLAYNPVRDDAGAITGVCVNVYSIDERKRAEERLLHVERLATIGQVTGAIAHEMRNPLSVISALSQEKGAENPDAARLQAQAAKLTRLMDDILAFSRKTDLKRGPVSPAALLQSALESARTQAGSVAARVAVRWNMILPVEELNGDRERLEQVFHNILLNAFQAVSEGGTVTLSCHREGYAAVLTVEDDGPGLPQKDLEHLFEPFYTTKKLGTGLGLALSRKIVEDHGGTIEAFRREPCGMVFKISLPFSSPTA
jgi:PAS domain S-box-containing protein